MTSPFTHFFPASTRVLARLTTGLLFCLALSASAQTSTDGLMMSKGSLCTVVQYSHDQWDHYWEGPKKRQNLNIGTVTTQSTTLMAAYGLVKNVNIMAALPYIWTHASAGTLHSNRGFQDVSVGVKWRPLEKEVPFGKISLFTVAGFSTPTSNYVADFLPLSIGMRSTTASIRGIAHYRTKPGLFLTVQGGYIRRSNIAIDRTAYYTDRQYNTNEVWMPDVAEFSMRTGYLGKHLTVEALLTRFTALGGYDIRRNDMPFPSNLMQATKVGANVLYRTFFDKNLSVTASYFHTTHGRNVGQSGTITAGLQYVFKLRKTVSPATESNLPEYLNN